MSSLAGGAGGSLELNVYEYLNVNLEGFGFGWRTCPQGHTATGERHGRRARDDGSPGSVSQSVLAQPGDLTEAGRERERERKSSERKEGRKEVRRERRDRGRRDSTASRPSRGRATANGTERAAPAAAVRVRAQRDETEKRAERVAEGSIAREIRLFG